MDPLKILSIDVGILNLGYIYAEIYFPPIENTSKYKNLKNNETYQSIKDNLQIISCDRIDILLYATVIVDYATKGVFQIISIILYKNI